MTSLSVLDSGPQNHMRLVFTVLIGTKKNPDASQIQYISKRERAITPYQ